MNTFCTVGCLDHAKGACVIWQREKTLVKSRVFAGARVLYFFDLNVCLSVCELHLASDDFFMLDSTLAVTRACKDHLVSRAN